MFWTCLPTLVCTAISSGEFYVEAVAANNVALQGVPAPEHDVINGMLSHDERVSINVKVVLADVDSICNFKTLLVD